jgi:hypothetical protein
MKVWMSRTEFEKVMTDTDETVHIEDGEFGGAVCGATTGLLVAAFFDEDRVTCADCLA